ncbi:hypothetical protein [Granulicella sibirica]|uniref:hypothetical protein n=1 Tax=Granulicella sibirica TaxID=2479048 RepID=UPI001008EA10|nr:hypothetical protein [Granulicella sibirica]
MKGKITITLEDGTTMSGTIALDLPSGDTETLARSLSAQRPEGVGLDFSIPLRPFMNENSDGLSGSKKFALLVSHFAKGELDVAVDRAEIIEAWNKMTGLLGGKFNGAHESRAKDSGWIYVPQAGKIALLKNWTKALS